MESAVIQFLAQRAATCEMDVLLIRDKATKQVLYLEAGKDFVDMVMSFLVLPVASFVTRFAEMNHVPASMCSIANILVCSRLSDEARFKRDDFVNPEVNSLAATETVSRSALLFEMAVLSDGVRDPETLSANTRWCFQQYVTRHQGAPVTCQQCKSVAENVQHAKRIVVKGPKLSPTFRPLSLTNRPFIVTDNLEIWPASYANLRALLRRLDVDSPDRLEYRSARFTPSQAQKLLALTFASPNALNGTFPDPPSAP